MHELRHTTQMCWMSELPDHEGHPRQCARHLLHSPRAGHGQLGARPGQLLLRHQGRHQTVPLLRVREVRVTAALQVTSCYVKYIVYCHVMCTHSGRATQEPKDSSHMSMRSRNTSIASSAKLEWTGSKCVRRHFISSILQPACLDPVHGPCSGTGQDQTCAVWRNVRCCHTVNSRAGNEGPWSFHFWLRIYTNRPGLLSNYRLP